jgi:Family of unknown function (DUF6529)
MGTLPRMEDLVDTITFGNVAQVKTVLASIAVALACYQVAMMAVGYNKVKTSFLGPRAASFAHRAVGDTILPITLLVAWMCWTYFSVGDGIEHAFDEETTRATIHVAAGSALVGVLVLKVIVIRWWKSMQRFLPHLGLTVFGLFVVTWVTSAGDYLWS